MVSFVDNVALIAEELEDLNAVYIRGDVPTADGKTIHMQDILTHRMQKKKAREERIKKFKTDDSCMVMVANPAAAGRYQLA